MYETGLYCGRTPKTKAKESISDLLTDKTIGCIINLLDPSDEAKKDLAISYAADTSGPYFYMAFVKTPKSIEHPLDESELYVLDNTNDEKIFYLLHIEISPPWYQQDKLDPNRVFTFVGEYADFIEQLKTEGFKFPNKEFRENKKRIGLIIQLMKNLGIDPQKYGLE